MKNIIILLILTTAIVNANDMYDIGNGDILLNGNGEQCIIRHNNKNRIINTTCLSFKNSKNINILCTKKKKICKTEKEVTNYIFSLNMNKKSELRYKERDTLTTRKGTVFKDIKNQHGHILKSRSYTIYVGRDCDISSPQFGKGYWDTDEYGSNIYVGKKVISFDKKIDTGCERVSSHESKRTIHKISSVPIWNVDDAEELIYTKLKAYGNAKAYGFNDSIDKNLNTSLNHKIVGFYDIPYPEYKHIIAVAATTPIKDYDCRACQPKLSFFEFYIKNGQWKIKNSYLNTIEYGEWGEAPSHKEIQTIKLGKNDSGLLFRLSSSTQGLLSENSSIYALMDNGETKNIFSEATAANDGGTSNPSTDWKATLKLDRSSNKFYNIILHKTGFKDTKKINEKIIYSYDTNKGIYLETVKNTKSKNIIMEKREEVEHFLTAKELCKLSERNFSKAYEKFQNAELNPNETEYSLRIKIIKARDAALPFIKNCKNISRNTFWNGGHSMEEVKSFVRDVNAWNRY